MRVEVGDYYVVGHSSVAPEDIVIAETGLGRFCLVDKEFLPEVIDALLQVLAHNNDTVNVTALRREGEALDASLGKITLEYSDELRTAIEKSYGEPGLTAEENDALDRLMGALEVAAEDHE
jgi:hypothetical protein